MFCLQIREFLNSVCEQIKYEPIREEIAQEMENHLMESKENYMSEGMSEKQAEETATKQMGNAGEIGKKLNKIHRPKLDWKLLLITFVLVIFGGLVSFTRAVSYNSNGKMYSQSIFCYVLTVFMGIFFSVWIYFLDYRKIFRKAKYLYGFASLLMVFTLMFGGQINGTMSRIWIGGVTIYAPAVAVPLYILAFIEFVQKIDLNKNWKIVFLENKEIRINIPILKIIVLCGISLILLELASATVYIVVMAIVYLTLVTVKLGECKKNRRLYRIILWGIAIGLGILFGIFVVPMMWHRIVASFMPEQDPMGRGWLGVQQNMILESANLFGEADNMSNALHLFDEGTNFAFISILAHYGWAISIAMIIAIVTFCAKLMTNAIQIKEMYGKLLIIAISDLFILQSIFNLLMNFNLGIKSNVNIPFISYGRQDLVVNMVCLALVLSVYRRKDILVGIDKKKEVLEDEK